jgi:hypothetical protein
MIAFVNSLGQRVTLQCDTAAHRVVATGERGEVKYSFGGFGCQPGALDTPLDIAFVRPQFTSEALVEHPDLLWIAVADYGNRRVQIFELDGVLVGAIDEELIDAGIGSPTMLTWRAPVLEVTGVDGAHARIHLGAALLWRGPSPATPPAGFHVRYPHARGAQS